MKKLKICLLLLTVIAGSPVALAAVPGETPEKELSPQSDTTVCHVAPGKYTEVVDSEGRRYRLNPIVPITGSVHSLSLELGVFPGCVNEPLFNTATGYYDDIGHWFWPGEYPGEQRYYEGAKRVTGGIGISYGYRVRRWFETGASLTYAGFYQNLYASADGCVAARERNHYVTLMPYARFSWVNRRSVRLYSSLHLGVQWSSQRSYFYDKSNYTYLAAHFTPFGIRVGRRLFGYAELGIGMRGVFVFGIGYGLGGNSNK